LVAVANLVAIANMLAMPRKAKEKKHRGVFEREKGSEIYWVRFLDVDGKRKARCIGNFSDAVNFSSRDKRSR
jgi:hypothetical protein